MRGDLDYNQGLDIQIKHNTEKDYNHETATMLINIYFPQLRPAFEAILHRRDEINRIQAVFKAAYKRGTSGEPFVQPFSQQLALIGEDEKKLTDELFLISSKIK